METAMSIIDQALKANERYAKTYDPKWGGRASAAENCGRDLHGSSSFRPSGNSWTEARRHRRDPNGGPNVTEDVLAELVVSTRVLGSKEIMLLNHTGCGFTTFTDAELNAKFSKLTGDATPAPMRFFAFKDPEQQTKDQIEMVRSHPWISKEVPVRGFIFDVNTGRLREVLA
jgi:carbonic anhydrase